MDIFRLPVAWTSLLACSAIALAALGPASADAQPLVACPGVSGPGMSFGSSDSTAIGSLGGGAFSWLSPNGWCGEGDPVWPDPWPGRVRRLFGDTALSRSNSLRFQVNDFSIVEMPQMIQPLPAEGWEPNNQPAARFVPRVEPPAPVPKPRAVRAPLNVTISPEGPTPEPRESGQQ